MDKANIAEWLLRWVMDPSRASEFVGDQLEAHPAAGNLRFWLAIGRVFLAFSWRTIVGVIASPIAGVILAFAFYMFVSPALQQLIAKPALSLPDETSRIHDMFYMLNLSILPWAAAIFSMIRFGWRSTLTRNGMIASILFSASGSFLDQRTPLIFLAVLWAAYLGFCLSRAHRRRALAILSIAVLLAWSTAFTLARVSHDLTSVFGKWQFFAMLALVPIVEGVTILMLQRRLLASDGRPVPSSAV